MATTDPLIAAILHKIAENDAALKPLLDERRFLDTRLREAQARYAGSVVAIPLSAKGEGSSAASATAAPRKPTFTAPRGGPQDTLLKTIELNDGIKSDALYDLALAVVHGTAKNQRRSLAETLRKLIQTGRVSRDKSGGLHIMA